MLVFKTNRCSTWNKWRLKESGTFLRQKVFILETFLNASLLKVRHINLMPSSSTTVFSSRPLSCFIVRQDSKSFSQSNVSSSLVIHLSQFFSLSTLHNTFFFYPFTLDFNPDCRPTWASRMFSVASSYCTRLFTLKLQRKKGHFYCTDKISIAFMWKLEAEA